MTCHLACQVTDYISKFSKAGEIFLPRLFQGFPEIKRSTDPEQDAGGVYRGAAGDCAEVAGRADQERGQHGVTRTNASYPANNVVIGFDEHATSGKTLREFIEVCGFTVVQGFPALTPGVTGAS